MKNEKILLDISYTDESGKCWSDSYIKNKIVLLDDDIHKVVAREIEKDDGMTMSYKGKPQGNIYVDDKDGNSKAIGYHYRCKNEYIPKEDRSGYITGYFTAWVTIKKIDDYPVKELI